MKKIIIFFFFGTFIFIVHAQVPQPCWELNGNANATNSNFIGTTTPNDCIGLYFKTRNIQRMKLSSTGSLLGIGTPTHNLTSLHVHYQKDDFECAELGSDEEDEPTDSFLGDKRLLQLTTPETGSSGNNGFLVTSSPQKEIQFKQQERANFLLEGVGGGLTIAPDGKVGVGIETPQAKLHVDGNINATGSFLLNKGISTGASLGSAYGEHLGWGTSYIGFNATRDNGDWKLASDGAHNGGGVIWSSVFGDLFFAAIPATGANPQTLTDTQLKNNIKLTVTADGVLKAKEVLIPTAGWPDYVFEENYNLLPLKDVEQHIKQYNRLPNVPSAAEVETEGINLGEMNALLMQKVEELTLYIIQLEKRLSEVENRKGGE